MKKIVQQDDHIIIPQATLKRFTDDKNLFSALSLSDPSCPNIKNIVQNLSIHNQVTMKLILIAK